MTREEASVLRRVVDWAREQPAVHAVILAGSRAALEGAVDAVSDYDVVLCVDDVERFAADGAWLEVIGRPLVRFSDTLERLGLPRHMRMVLYEDGTKVDFAIVPAGLLRVAASEGRLPPDLDTGYRVLFDREGAASALPGASDTAHLPSRPSESEYLALIEEFWWESTYVARYLWREDVLPARYSLDVVMRHDLLRRMLEWLVEVERGWTWRPGAMGRRLRDALDRRTAAELDATYAPGSVDGSWEGLSRTAALFRRVASEVGTALGYDYPRALDEGVTAYIEGLRDLEESVRRP